MNDDSAAQLERTRVSPVFTGADPPRTLREPGSFSWLRRSLLGTLCQALSPTPIPAGRTLPASVSVCELFVFQVDSEDSATLFPGNVCFQVPDLQLDLRVGSGLNQWLSMFLFPASLGQVMRQTCLRL